MELIIYFFLVASVLVAAGWVRKAHGDGAAVGMALSVGALGVMFPIIGACVAMAIMGSSRQTIHRRIVMGEDEDLGVAEVF